jgi:hypothetical protein
MKSKRKATSTIQEKAGIKSTTPKGLIIYWNYIDELAIYRPIRVQNPLVSVEKRKPGARPALDDYQIIPTNYPRHARYPLDTRY